MNLKASILGIFTRCRDSFLCKIFIGIVLIAGIIWFGEYRRIFLINEIARITDNQKKDTQELETRIAILEEELFLTKEENTSTVLSLQTKLEGQENKSATFQQEINKIAGAVGTLDKLSKTDEELLQKYSKIYFLNEHYVPLALANVDVVHKTEPDKDIQVHANILPFLTQMLSAAKNAGLQIQVASAFRSFGAQSQLKSNYRFLYGSGTANQFSADQGYSEHQLGTTVDLVTPATATSFAGFDLTPEYRWLLNNAHVYGFVLSYPKDNEYYEYEPWHWRFVGVSLATRLYNEHKYFYDFDQREINKYLVNIFD